MYVCMCVYHYLQAVCFGMTWFCDLGRDDVVAVVVVVVTPWDWGSAEVEVPHGFSCSLLFCGWTLCVETSCSGQDYLRKWAGPVLTTSFRLWSLSLLRRCLNRPPRSCPRCPRKPRRPSRFLTPLSPASSHSAFPVETLWWQPPADCPHSRQSNFPVGNITEKIYLLNTSSCKLSFCKRLHFKKTVRDFCCWTKPTHTDTHRQTQADK